MSTSSPQPATNAADAAVGSAGPAAPVATAGSAAPAEPSVEVRRSARRKRTVSAHREGDTIVVSIPARMSAAEERRWVAQMVERVTRSESRRRPSDDALLDRAGRLSARYLGGRAVPKSVVWSSVQRARWGSATPLDGSIRISSRLRGAPDYVLDYVLLHELAHLLVADHGPDFHALLADYPQLERARGFLDGVTAVTDGHLDAVATSTPDVSDPTPAAGPGSDAIMD